MELVPPSDQYMSALRHCATCFCGVEQLEPAHLSQSLGPAHAGTIDKLDQTIANMRQTLSKLASKRSTLLSIHRIPAEIILRVFHEALYPISEDYLTASTNISSTCSYWRKLAISDPTSWSKVTKARLPMVRGILDRSGIAPLYVSCKSVRHKHMPALQELMKEVHRITHLQLECARDATFHKTLSQFNGDLHSLQFLSVHVRSPQRELKLVCNAPNMTSLELFHCSIRERPPFYAHKLRRFVFDSHFHSDDGLQLDVWLDLLSSFPLLEELVLRSPLDAEWRSRTGEMVGHRVSTMKNLRQLSLRGEIEEVTVFLTYIAFPPVTQTLIHLEFMRETEEDFEEQMEAFSELFYL